jgi:hypothetical protein
VLPAAFAALLADPAVRRERRWWSS